MRLALLTIAAVILCTAFPAEAGWEAPEGQPYTVSKHVLDDSWVHRIEVAVARGIVAWVEQPRDQNPDPRAGGNLRILQLDLDDPNASRFASAPAAGPASRISASERFVVWKEGTEVHAYDLQTHETHFVWLSKVPNMHPRLEGNVVGWVDHGSQYGGGRRLFRYDLSQAHNFTDSQAWPSPFACAEEAWPSGAWLVVRVADCGSPPTPPGGPANPYAGRHGIFLYDPASNVIVPATDDDVVDWWVDAGRIVWVAYRQGEGRGTNLYLYDIASNVQRRLTWSEGRESSPSLSGAYVVWSDLRSERTPMPTYNLYFQNVLTFNEYKIEDTWSFTAGPAHHKGHLVFADEIGRLILAELPAAQELLDVRVSVTQIRTASGDTLEFDLEANGTTEAAWDTNLDGVFETQGPLTVPLGDLVQGETAVVGRAADTDGRVATVAFTYEEASRFAMGMGGSGLFRVKQASTIEDSDQTPRDSNSIPGLTFLTIAFVIAGQGVTRRIRGRHD